MRNIKTISYLSMLLAIAIVLNVIEMQINIIPVPGAKIGFANIAIVIVLYLYGFKEATLLTILRVLIVGMLYRSFTITFWMGLGGAAISVVVMGIFKKLKLHLITVSVLGAIAHTLGQIIVGIFLLETELLILYLPIMLLISVPAGVLIGIIGNRFLRNFTQISKSKTY